MYCNNTNAQDTLTILHLNDTHSTLSATGPRTADLNGTQGGIARAATIIGLNKMTEPNVLTLHAGDAFIGDLFFNVYFGAAEFQLLNAIGLDAFTLGNHEFDLMPSTLYGAMQASFKPEDGFPFLSANLILPDPSVKVLEEYVHPFTVKQVGNIKVGIFGLTTPEANLLSNPSPAIINDDIINIAAAMVDSLKAHNCDVIILLSHLGSGLDKTVAAYIPGINIIVGGHDHYLFNAPVEVVNSAGKTTYIVQAKSNYLDMGKMQLLINNSEVSVLNYRIIPLDKNIPEEPTVLAEVNKLITGIENIYGPLYTQQFGYANGIISEDPSDLMSLGHQDSPAGNLVSDAFRWKTKTDIAIQPNGNMAQPIYEGPFVGADVFRMNGYGFNTIDGLGFQLVTFNLTGEGLLAGLEFGLSDIENNHDFMIQGSGINYLYNSGNPPYSRLVAVTINGKPINPSAEYTVTANESIPSILDFLGIEYSNLNLLNGTTEFGALSEYIMLKGGNLYPKITGRIANINTAAGKELLSAVGWLNSQPGSILSNPDISGKLLVTVNVKKTNTVSGNVLLIMPKNKLLFQSTAIDWLTIENNTAQVKGSGKINGKSGYGFLITAANNGSKFNSDKLRIIIFDKKNNETLVYDNFEEQKFNGIIFTHQIEISKELVNLENTVPINFELKQNYPNPFNPVTNFEFTLPNRQKVSLKIFDILGNEVAVIVNNELTSGIYKYQWNAAGNASGVYIYRLEAGSFISTKKLILMK